jgi:uncharacterized membrane protein YdbT with pleckstrin-like domain
LPPGSVTMFEIGRPRVKYPKSLLSVDETVMFDVHHHPVVLWWPAFLVFLYLALWIAMLFISHIFRGGTALIVGFAGLATVAAFLVSRTVSWSHTNLVLTNHRLIYRAGFFTRHSRETPVSMVTDVSSSQLILGRIFGYGDLLVELSGEHRKVPYFNFPHPAELQLQILEQLRAIGKPGTGEVASSVTEEVAMAVARAQPTREIASVPPERPPLYSEIVDQIERLDELREKGSLSEEEFRTAKESLLNRIGGES